MDVATGSAIAALVVAALAFVVAIAQVAQQYLITGSLLRLCDSTVFGHLPGRGQRFWETRQLRFRVLYSLPQVRLQPRLWRDSPDGYHHDWMPRLRYALQRQNGPSRAQLRLFGKLRKRSRVATAIWGLWRSVTWLPRAWTRRFLRRIWRSLPVAVRLKLLYRFVDSDKPGIVIYKDGTKVDLFEPTGHNTGEASWASLIRIAQYTCEESLHYVITEGDADRCPADLPVIPMQVSLREIAVIGMMAGMRISHADLHSGLLSMAGDIGSITSSRHSLLGGIIHFHPNTTTSTCGWRVQNGAIDWMWVQRLRGLIPIAGKLHNTMQTTYVQPISNLGLWRPPNPVPMYPQAQPYHEAPTNFPPLPNAPSPPSSANVDVHTGSNRSSALDRTESITTHASAAHQKSPATTHSLDNGTEVDIFENSSDVIPDDSASNLQYSRLHDTRSEKAEPVSAEGFKDSPESKSQNWHESGSPDQQIESASVNKFDDQISSLDLRQEYTKFESKEPSTHSPRDENEQQSIPFSQTRSKSSSEAFDWGFGKQHGRSFQPYVSEGEDDSSYKLHLSARSSLDENAEAAVVSGGSDDSRPHRTPFSPKSLPSNVAEDGYSHSNSQPSNKPRHREGSSVTKRSQHSRYSRQRRHGLQKRPPSARSMSSKSVLSNSDDTTYSSDLYDPYDPYDTRHTPYQYYPNDKGHPSHPQHQYQHYPYYPHYYYSSQPLGYGPQVSYVPYSAPRVVQHSGHPVAYPHQHIGFRWQWLSQMDTMAGYSATPFAKMFKEHLFIRITAVVLEALQAKIGDGALVYTNGISLHDIRCEPFRTALAWVSMGRSTWPSYVHNARGGVVAKEQPLDTEFLGFADPLPRLRLFKDLTDELPCRGGYISCTSPCRSCGAPRGDTADKARVAELVLLDTWLSICGRASEIVRGSSNLLNNMPAAIQFVMDSFEGWIASIERLRNNGGLQQIQSIKDAMAHMLEEKGLSRAEQVFLLVALLRTAKVGMRVALGPDTSDILHVLENDVRVWLV